MYIYQAIDSRNIAVLYNFLLFLGGALLTYIIYSICLTFSPSTVSFVPSISNTFAEFGMKVYDKTEDNNSWRRGKGIHDYLQKYPVTHWIVLDDETFPDYNQYEIESHWIKTAYSIGLTEELKEMAIAQLLKSK
jgi:hypothetical protein